MPDIDKYSFKYSEVLEALIKKADLHEGRWQITMTFGFGATNIGPTPEELVPGAAVAVTSIGLQRAKPESPSALVGDAAALNPATSNAPQRQPSRSQRGASSKA